MSNDLTLDGLRDAVFRETPAMYTVQLDASYYRSPESPLDVVLTLNVLRGAEGVKCLRSKNPASLLAKFRAEIVPLFGGQA